MDEKRETQAAHGGMAMTDPRLRHYYLPGEDRVHYAVFAGSQQLTRWTVSRSEAEQFALHLEIPTRIRSEIRAWDVSPIEWGRSEDARDERRWDEWVNRDHAGVPLEPRKRRAAF